MASQGRPSRAALLRLVSTRQDPIHEKLNPSDHTFLRISLSRNNESISWTFQENIHEWSESIGRKRYNLFRQFEESLPSPGIPHSVVHLQERNFHRMLRSSRGVSSSTPRKSSRHRLRYGKTIGPYAFCKTYSFSYGFTLLFFPRKAKNRRSPYKGVCGASAF